MSVEGTYEIVASTPFGDLKSTVTLKVDGNNLSGRIKFFENVTEFSGGKVSGNMFELETTLGTPLGNMKAMIKGFAEAEQITGEIKVFMGTFKFSGKRI